MKTTQFYRDAFLEYLKTFTITREPKSLYEPVNYILKLGGKRLRPTLTLMGAETFNCDYQKALPAALSIEVFHNFSLIHDDIMDAAPLRRNQQTVHEKWNINTGILSGDAMLILAYQLFENYNAETFQQLAKLFSKTALQVCEGQQYDIDFETNNSVSVFNYIKMITYKTAVLIGAALQMGAIVANASAENQIAIYNFGKNLGIAFQIQDDFLDAFGNPEKFGKQIGGDIIENKKTFLYLHALANASNSNVLTLKKLYQNNTLEAVKKIETVKQIFKDSGTMEATKKEIEKYTKLAFSQLESLSISAENKKAFIQFGNQLMTRNT